MKTTIGKVLAVATSVASLMFLGFVSVAVFGGANWERQAKGLEGYTFSRTEGENPQWTATEHVGGQTFTQSKVIEPVLDAVYSDMISDLTEEQRTYTEQIPALEQELAQMKPAIEADLAALQAAVDDFQQRLDARRSEVQANAEAVEQAAAEVQRVEDLIESRREDVERLSAQVGQIRDDRFRIEQIQRQLRDLIKQIDGSLQRASQRQEQLKSVLEG
ncbi:MAG: hypothetical protein DWQ34_17850 [Planctomycetota bacterium]|nr:MAG: hypothetical protein DWQ29_10480 [Planctomycetota bacterium]REJ90227.1 MAG: hypothetical protein DWQ34_17850 [Planctomycetota bacterium]REK20829.1 MAG: hypothetical protein DWQ41_23585 [Planctomycetota bacterium]REK36056.1 MAG: hypothetical protein DWQ45_10245 [Planctomycetota bacterium]